MDAFDELAQSLLIKTEALSMAFWRPETDASDGPITASKFAGTPWLTASGWPLCPIHGGSLALQLQLNGTDWPEPVQARYGPGLMQLFVCPESDCREYLARRLETVVADAPQPPQPETVHSGPARRILSWYLAGADTPMPEACRQLCSEQSIELSGAESDLLDEMAWAEPGDKLGGWPHRSEAMPFPDCPDCGQRLQMLVQLAENSQLFQCPIHLDLLIYKENPHD